MVPQWSYEPIAFPILGVVIFLLGLGVPTALESLMKLIVNIESSATWLGSNYLRMAEVHPLLTAVGTACAKGVISDLIAQVVVEQTVQINLNRVLAFAVFGALYLGMVGHYKYAVIYPALFGVSKTASAVAVKVIFDLFLNGPLVYFPIYFIIKGFFAGKGPVDALTDFFTVKGRNLVLRYWVVWTPVEVAMWTFVPPNLRVPFLSLVSLIWTIVLSTLSFRQPKHGH